MNRVCLTVSSVRCVRMEFQLRMSVPVRFIARSNGSTVFATHLNYCFDGAPFEAVHFCYGNKVRGAPGPLRLA